MPGRLDVDAEAMTSFISTSFPRSSMKREMMCRRLEILRQAMPTQDIDTIRMVLGDFLAEARSLHEVIQREAKPVEGFGDWWAGRIAQLKQDPLMNWAHKARAGGYHEGIPSIEVTGWEIKGAFEYDPEQRSDAKNLVMTDRGMFWYSSLGTADERIERARIRADHHAMFLHIPELSVEEGAPQSMEDIPGLCEKIARRNQELLHEVKVTFASAALGIVPRG